MDSVIVMQGKTVLEEEDELVASVGRLAAARKCDRVAAYRQLQAVSHMTQQPDARPRQRVRPPLPAQFCLA
jgi:hypothetical protein